MFITENNIIIERKRNNRRQRHDCWFHDPVDRGDIYQLEASTNAYQNLAALLENDHWN